MRWLLLGFSLGLNYSCSSEPQVGNNHYNLSNAQVTETTVSNVALKVYLPPGHDPSKPAPLGVYLHGDTAKDYFDESYFVALKDFALQKGMVFVAALSPNQNSWWHSDSYATNFEEVLVHLQNTYGVSQRQHYFAGTSGGSTFLSMQYLPYFGVRRSAVYALNCGGSQPRNFASEITDEWRKRNRLRYIYGDKDFLADPNGYWGDRIHASINAYRALKVPVEVRVLPGIGHCQFDVSKTSIEAWKDALSETQSEGDPGSGLNIRPGAALGTNIASGQYMPTDGQSLCRQIVEHRDQGLVLRFPECQGASNLQVNLNCGLNQCIGTSSTGIRHTIQAIDAKNYRWSTSSGLSGQFQVQL